MILRTTEVWLIFRLHATCRVVRQARVHAERNDPIGARKYAERMARLKLSDKEYLIKLNEISALLGERNNFDKNLPANPGGN